MIRHAGARTASPVLPLAFAMILPGFRAVAVAAIGAAVLIKPGLSAASHAAIALSPVTTGADKELGTAFTAAANSLPQGDLATSSHAASQAGLDNANRFVAL